ncbi:hypothetical protein SCHPADRAFT_819107 [Schizopora paradoxa]|uniref:Uncharacterized protein n=1 Tax=Schizopora paradoxa TaxID=27342 RepID=A0A0H2S429_9AGAM|nr:hypothetical protein SCHPADRAFT_819107 [Schizopora paradoxa]
MPPLNPEAEVYVKELRKLRYGFPLYDPDPAQSYDRVRIGDVGHVTDNGCFLRLFNVFYPEGDPINALGVPDGFVLFDEIYRRSHISQAIQPGVICSSHFRRIEGGASFNGGVIPAGLTIRLSCADQQGAALVIKRRAIREETRCGNAFRELILKNYHAWYTFAHDTLQADIRGAEDIFLVTGHILTNEWATATVVEKARNCEIRFNAGDELSPFGGASASLWGSWTSSVSLPLRFGPTSIPPQLTNVHNTALSAPASPTSSIASPISESIVDSVPNQCIFLRAFRVAARPFFLRKIKAAAEPKDENDRDLDEENHRLIAMDVGVDDDDESEDEHGSGKQRDAFEVARDYIFMVR